MSRATINNSHSSMPAMRGDYLYCCCGECIYVSIASATTTAYLCCCSQLLKLERSLCAKRHVSHRED